MLGIPAVYLVIWSLLCAAAPKNAKERALDDEAQIEYLTKYKK